MVPNISVANLATVLDLSATGADDNFNLTVSIQVTIPSGQRISSAWVIYYNDDGTTETMPTSVNGTNVSFTTTHCSYYAYYVLYDDIIPPFIDDGDDYVPVPPTPVEKGSDDDNSVTVIACAAAAVVAALLAVFLIVDKKRP